MRGRGRYKAFIVFGNSLVVIAVARFRWLRTSANLLVNLSCADLLEGTIVLPLHIAIFLLPHIMLNLYVCMVRYVVIILPVYTTGFMLIAISVDRYIAVTKPLHYAVIMTRQRTLGVCIATWSITSAYAFAPLFGWNTCHDGMPCVFTHIYPMSYIFTYVGICPIGMIILAALNLRVYSIAKKYQRRQPGKFSETAANTAKLDTKDTSIARPNTKAAKTLAMVTSAYIVFTLPYVIVISAELIYDTSGRILNDDVAWFHILRASVGFVGVTNSFVNPFIYHYRMPEFRCAFRALLGYNNKEEIAQIQKMAAISHRR